MKSIQKQKLIPLVVACISLLATIPVQAAAIKCWTNKDGVRECGNVIPQEYSQGGAEVFNEQGRPVDKIERAKSREQIELEQRKLEEEKRLKEQEAQDQILLGLFGTEEDIEMSRQAVLSTIDGQVGSIETFIESLKRNLADMEMNLEKAKTNPDISETQLEAIRSNVKNAKQRVKDNEDTLQAKRNERNEANKKHDEYLARFREIKDKGTGYISRMKEKAKEEKVKQAVEALEKPPESSPPSQ